MEQAQASITLSAVIVARNEAGLVRPCLERLDFVDEIVFVVDSRSDDETAQVAREFTDQVHVREFDSFSGQRNYSIDKAQGEWILVVDVDERVTPALARQIQHAVACPGAFVAFALPRAHFGFGKQLRCGGWRDQTIRLIRRENVRYHGVISELPEVSGPVGTLSAELWHFSHTDIGTMLAKTKRDGPLMAQQMLDNCDPPVTTVSLLTAPARAFLKRMIKMRAFQDGLEGVVEAVFYAFSVFCLHVMLWEKQRQPALDETYARLEAKATEEHPERIRGRFIA